MNIADRIEVAASHAGIKLIDIARKLGVSTATVSSWKNERFAVGKYAKALAQLLSVSEEWLIQGTGNSPEWLTTSSSAIVKIDPSIVESIRGLEKALSKIQTTLLNFPSTSQEQKDLNDQARHLLGTLTEEIARLRKTIKGHEEMSAELSDMRNQIELNNEILRIMAKKVLGENVYIPTFKVETELQTAL